MKYIISALSAAAVTTAINPCRNKPDGTTFIDPENPQGYLECQDGQPVPQDCPNDYWWDLNMKKCDIQKACYPPSYFGYYDYGYQDGIYYLTDISMSNPFTVFQSRLLCQVIGAKLAMPYTDKEYDFMVEIQNRNLKAYQELNPGFVPVNSPDGFDFEFFVGIEDIWRSNQTSFTYATYYYYEDSRRQGMDVKEYGPEFTQNQWWSTGYPTNEQRNPKNNVEHWSETHVVQDGSNGLRNVPYFGSEYKADGVNCMYVCPGYT